MATATSINLSSLDGSNGFRLDGGGYYFNKFSLSSAGDINGDGFDDVAIGTYFDKYYSEGSYLVFGKTSGFSASMSLFGLDGENGFGIDVAKGRASSVSRAGDINGDGFDDMVIVEGGRFDYYGYFAANNTYVVFGKQDGFNASLNPSDLDGSNGFHLEGGAEHKFLGVSVSGAGDINGDGLDDLIVGNSGDPGSNSLGSSYVVFGKTSGFDAVIDVSDLDGINGFRLDGVAKYDASGYSVSGAGDVNGDGFDDLIIGAPGAGPNGIASGSSYVVFGKSSGFDTVMSLSALDGGNGFRLDGMSDRDFSGSSVSSAGDVNGDGFNDVLVSGRFSGSDVIFGKAAGFDAAMNLSTLDGNNGFHLDGSGLAIPVSSAGDVNGDGFDDLIIGNSRADLNGYFSGSSYVMFGKASGFDAAIKLSDLDSTNSVRLDGVARVNGAGGDQLGVPVSGAGDINGDGYDDLMIGAPGARINFGAGSVYVVFGSSEFDGTVTYVGTPENDSFTGTEAAEHFDPSVGNDLLIGGGGADVMYGGKGDDTIWVSDLDFQLVDGGSGNDTLALDGSGMNLDLANFQDKISGIETIDLGGTGNNILTLTVRDIIKLSNTTDALTVKGDAGNRVAGLSNGWVDSGIQDGFHVFTQNSAELRIATAVDTDFVANGGGINLSTLDGVNGFRLDGANDRDFSGKSVSNAGDVNGDGFDDVIIGAPGADPNGNDSGSSYVVFGKATGFDAVMNLSELDGNNGFRLDGAAERDYAGRSVSGAGDINGDGLDDVIIGAYRAEYSSGSSYVVFGKSTGFDATMNLSDLDGVNGFRLDGAVEDDESGFSVSNAGDVNGDGFDDLIVGAPGADPNGPSGSSYIVFGKEAGFSAAMELSDLDGRNGFRLDGENGTNSGWSVSSAGDVNNDGFDDVFVGAPFPNGIGGYIIFGKASDFDATMKLSDLDGSNGFRLDSRTPFDFKNSLVSNAGDVNGDGFADLIVGAYGAEPNGYYSGSSYVVFGKASGFSATINVSDLDGSNGFRLDGGHEYDYSGISVSSAGDVNGDGFDDVIVGADRTDSNDYSSTGSSYVVFGKASGFDATMSLSDLDSSNGFRLDGVARFGGFGASVSGAGDINGDGFDDLIIGSPSAASSGSSYVIFGRSDFTGGGVDFPGTPGNDNFTGTKAAERFEGGAGNDRMIGRGGADSFDGGTGNDYIRISDANFQSVDGGSGTDILGLAGSNFNLDLPSVIDKIHGIETISLYGVGDNSLTLTASNVLDLSDSTDTLKIKGNAGDSVVGLSSGWMDGGIHGNFHTYTQVEAVLLIGVGMTTDFPVI